MNKDVNDMKKNKVYLQRDTTQYRILGRFPILATMLFIIAVSSIVLIVDKFFL